MKLYLYKISQEVNTSYDTYDSAVVCAENAEDAVKIHPSGMPDWDGKGDNFGPWCNKEDVNFELIGIACAGMKRGVICASFNAD